MRRTIKRFLIAVAVIFIVAYSVNRIWRVEEGVRSGVIEQWLFGE